MSPKTTDSKSEKEEKLEIGSLDKEKLKLLMKRDPKFIGRLIDELDRSMNGRMTEKKRREDQIQSDQREIARIDEAIRTHITHHMDRLEKDLTEKRALQERMSKELADMTHELAVVEREAASLTTRTKNLSQKLLRGVASQRLEDARGYSGTLRPSEMMAGATRRKPEGSN
mmetsp:Transcript_10259/g.18948  ORF Transcript_10259/g.18948 Transcript_10259/m.18948 type:complete len:171 (-) Transcript_10259:380-892(-)